MAEALSLQVEPRDPAKNKGTGTRAARKIRAQGRVPAILYGHKQDPVPFSLTNEDVALMLKKQAHLTQLNLGGTTELAVVRDVQWDYLGKQIIHLDFMRVSADEQVEAEVAIELHGTPVGLSEGGRLEQLMRSLTIKSRPTAIPNHVTIEVGGLHVNQSLHVRDLKAMLPEGVVTEMDEGLLVVHVVEKTTGSGAEIAEEGEEAEGEEGAEGAKPEGDEQE